MTTPLSTRHAGDRSRLGPLAQLGLLVGTQLALLWVVASAASRGRGFVPFAAGAGALAIALAAYARGRRNALYLLFFLTLLAACGVAAFEGLLRLAPGVLQPPIANIAYTGYHWVRGGVYELDAHAGPLLKADVHRDMYWQGYWWRHDTNPAGFRGEALARADAVFLGDSMIYGHGVENGETVPAAFQAITGARTANLGQQGTSLLQSLMILERKGLALQPRVIYACSHPTDVEDTVLYYAPEELARFERDPGYRPRIRAKWQPPARWDPVSFYASQIALPLRCSGIVGAVVRSVRDGTFTLRRAAPPGGRFVPSADPRPFAPLTPGATAAQALAWRTQVGALREMARHARRLGARLVVFDLGYPEAETRAVEAAALSLGAEYSPAGREALRRAEGGEEMYLRDDGHWTPAGCRAVAEALARSY